MQKQCPYCTKMMDANVEYCPNCRAKNIKDYSINDYSYNTKSHTHTGDSICDNDDDPHRSMLRFKMTESAEQSNSTASAKKAASNKTLSVILSFTMICIIYALVVRSFIPLMLYDLLPFLGEYASPIYAYSVEDFINIVSLIIVIILYFLIVKPLVKFIIKVR